MSVNGDEGKRRAKRGATEAVDNRPFEEQLDELDALVATLEEGRLPLEEALTLYERGMRLAQACQRRLDDAELRVSALRATSLANDNESGEFTLESIDIEGA
ncbi:MAG TPA: exodeoxyribonuclease VII small subunit [Ktedonobacterales bacterium]